MSSKAPLSITHPELSKQAVGWDPREFSSGSTFKKLWRCQLGHSWNAVIQSRVAGRGCPYCSNQKVLQGFNDLSSRFPLIAIEAYGWDPTTITFGSNKKFVWKCLEGHSWEAAVSSRTGRNSGCPTCQNQKVLSGFNDLATTVPQIGMEADGWDPSTVFKGNVKKRNWKCSLGHSWKASANSRTSQNSGCPICGNKKLLKGFNDLETTHTVIAKEADGWDPSTIFHGNVKKRNWKCSLGHSWKASALNRTTGNTGCPVCSNKIVMVGFNDLATSNPEIAKAADGWDPTLVTSGSNQKKRWKCSEGHTWVAKISQVAAGRTWCPTCASSGFDINAESWLYFLSHLEWQMLQIGITNFPEARLNKHKKLGWEIIELRGPMDGLIAREWESSILQMLKRCGAKLAPDEVAGKFDGFTEAWLRDSFPVSSLLELMNKVKDEE